MVAVGRASPHMDVQNVISYATYVKYKEMNQHMKDMQVKDKRVVFNSLRSSSTEEAVSYTHLTLPTILLV